MIYYPTDSEILRGIHREIVALHCKAAVKYMDELGLDDSQKIIVISGVLDHLMSRQSLPA